MPALAGAAPEPTAAEVLLAAGRGQDGPATAPELRRMQISEFAVWLRSRTNRNKRPFQEATVAAYADAARSLDRWMTGQEIDGDFSACGTEMLNRFFTGWVTKHGQAGLNTRQRNLRHLSTWLEEAYGHPHPYTAALHRYAPLKQRPSTLAQEFIGDLLTVTGGGRARGFEDARDHAMIRMLTEGVRRMELIQLELPDLSSDLIARPFVRVVPLKSARAFTEGRIVPLAAATSRSLASYLRVRRSHRLASSTALWLGTRNRGPLTGSGLYRMLKRRAEQAGYEPDVHPHQFRHTFANDQFSMPASTSETSRSPPGTPTRAPPCATTEPART